MNLGRAEGLLGELRELTTRHPNREHVWYLYVLALHESGRRSEALSEYELIRRRLADQFGTEPGPELRALHPRLLGGPALEDAARGPSGRVPRQLPRVPARCLRRKRELARLNGLIPSPHESTPVVATVTGPPGIWQVGTGRALGPPGCRRLPGRADLGRPTRQRGRALPANRRRARLAASRPRSVPVELASAAGRARGDAAVAHRRSAASDRPRRRRERRARPSAAPWRRRLDGGGDQPGVDCPSSPSPPVRTPYVSTG